MNDNKISHGILNAITEVIFCRSDLIYLLWKLNIIENPIDTDLKYIYRNRKVWAKTYER